MHPIFLLILGISCPRQHRWLLLLQSSPLHKSWQNCLKGNPQLLYQPGHVIFCFRYLYKEVFHHYFDILGNNSNEFYSVTKRKPPSYLHLADLLFPFWLKSPISSDIFSFCTFHIFACNTAFFLCLFLKIHSCCSLHLFHVSKVKKKL